MVRKGLNKHFEPIFKEISLSENCDYEILIGSTNISWRLLRPRIHFNRASQFEKRALECEKLGRGICPRTVQEVFNRRPFLVISYDDIQKGVYRGKRYWDWRRRQTRLYEQQRQRDERLKDKDPWERLGVKIEDLEFETPPQLKTSEVGPKAAKLPSQKINLQTVKETSEEKEPVEKWSSLAGLPKPEAKEDTGRESLDAFFKSIRDSMQNGASAVTPKPVSSSAKLPGSRGFVTPFRVSEKRLADLRDSMRAANVGSCPICLYDDHQFTSKLVGCGHKFCTRCADGWSQIENKCPLCKTLFHAVEQYDNGRFVEVKQVSDRKQVYKPIETTEDRIIRQADKACYMCNKGNKRNFLLICDYCLTKTCHTDCLDPPLSYVPQDQWFCDFCVQAHSLETRNPTAGYFDKRKPKRGVTRKKNLETNVPEKKPSEQERAKTRRIRRGSDAARAGSDGHGTKGRRAN